jgi:hypothetical protein
MIISLLFLDIAVLTSAYCKAGMAHIAACDCGSAEQKEGRFSQRLAALEIPPKFQSL